MTRTRKVLLGLGTLSALAVGAFFAVPVVFGFNSVGPPPLQIGDRAEESLALVLGRSDGAQPAEDLSTVGDEVEVGAITTRIETADGAWIVTGDSVAGYRVFKDFVGAREFEAVGRTSEVTGDLVIEDDTVIGAEFDVFVGTITSDDPRRDAQFRGPILMTDIYRTATFELTSPIQLGDAARTGEPIVVEAQGQLTLKGVTNDVDLELTARLVGDEVQVSGSIDVEFDDFDIEPPFTPTIVVRDSGIIEFSLFFEAVSSV